MSITQFRDQLPDFAKDVRINLGSVLTEEGAPGIHINAIWGIALSCSYATRFEPLVAATLADASQLLSFEQLNAAKSAAAIMAMNNVFYRAIHLANDAELGKLPAKLRMSVIGKPGIDKSEFELYCLAVSAINGCGACIEAHVREARKANFSSEAIQSALRIASVMASAAQAALIVSMK